MYRASNNIVVVVIFMLIIIFMTLSPLRVFTDGIAQIINLLQRALTTLLGSGTYAFK